MTRRLFISLAAAVALFAPATAHSSTATVSNGTLTITAGAGEKNDLGIERVASGEYRLQDNTSPVTPGAGCSATPAQPAGKAATCTGVTAIDVSFADGDDLLHPNPGVDVPVKYAGGTGDDTIIYPQATAGFSLSGDGVANDGPTGKDNIAGDVEQLFGTAFADTLTLGPSGGALVAGDGDDTLTGSSGDDTLRAAYVEDVGEDAGSFYPRGRDTVTCGAGEDTVLSDSDDVVAKDCEVVASYASATSAFTVTGSPHADVIGPLPYGWGPATTRAGSGNDTIRTSDMKRVYGGRGNDRIMGLDQAAQSFYGEAGNDRIDVRDKKPAKFNRDTVSCGSGKDLVYANENDKVSRDCERVKRR